uniref:amidohydrolase family protein n=1 Tax=Mycobacterium sp. TaxID=1785 RepID=UPI00262944BF
VADGSFGGLERAGTMSSEAVEEVISDSLRAYAVAGVTTVRDLGDRDYRTLAFRDRAGLPRVVASGPPLTTPGGQCHFLGGAMDGDLRAAVAERAERGVDVIKVMASGGFATPGSDPFGAQLTTAQLTALVDEAHRVGLPIVAHAHSLRLSTVRLGRHTWPPVARENGTAPWRGITRAWLVSRTALL